MRLIVKIKSFLPGNMTCLLNAQRHLLRTPLEKISSLASQLEKISSLTSQYGEIIKKYNFETISSLIKRRGIDGTERIALPDDIYGIAHLSLEEIKELKHLNIIIIDKSNNIF